MLVGMTIANGAYAQSSVTLYGLIDTSIAYVNNQSNHGKPLGSGWSMGIGSLNGSRWGIRGTEQLGGGMSAIFTLENGFSPNNGAIGNGGDVFGRQAFVGLRSTSYGAVTLGRQYDFVVDFVSPLGVPGPGWGGNLAVHPFDNDDSIKYQRLNQSIKYVSPNYRGLRFGAMYAFSNRPGQFSNNRAYSAGVAYTNGPLSLATAYLQVDRDANPVNANPTGALSTDDGDSSIRGGRERIWGVAGRYRIGPASVGLSWTHSTTDDVTGVWTGGKIAPLNGRTLTFDNYSIDGRYAFTPALSAAAGYTFTDGRFDASTQSAHPKWHQVVLQADYALSKRTDVYLEGVYKRSSGGNGNPVFNASVYTFGASSTDTQVAVAAGLRHKF
nr:porin [Burkholderia sp. RF4-BP95]